MYGNAAATGHSGNHLQAPASRPGKHQNTDAMLCCSDIKGASHHTGAAHVVRLMQEAQVVSTEKKRLSAELAAAMQRAVAAEMAHRLLLHDRDRAIEERAAHHQVQFWGDRLFICSCHPEESLQKDQGNEMEGGQIERCVSDTATHRLSWRLCSCVCVVNCHQYWHQIGSLAAVHHRFQHNFNAGGCRMPCVEYPHSTDNGLPLFSDHLQRKSCCSECKHAGF